MDVVSSIRPRACSRTWSAAPRTCPSRTEASMSSPAASPHTISRTSQRGVAEMARVSRDLVLVVDNLLMGDEDEEAEPPSRSVSCPQLLRGGVAGARSTDAGLTSRRRRGRAADLLRAVARAHRLHGGGCRRACASSLADRIDGRPAALDGSPQGEASGLVAIIVDTETRLVVQGITGREGSFHATRNKAYGTNVVAGVTPGKGGADVEGIPVFDSVRAAVAETSPNTAMVFVPARFAADAIYEAVDAGIETVICITEGIPAHDMLRVYNYIRPARRDDGRPELPRRALAGEGERRDHPGGDLPGGQRRPRLAIRHAHVPDRTRADATRYRSIHYRRNWGGPRRRVVLFGRPRSLRGRPRDRVRRHGRARSVAPRRRRPRASSKPR